MQSNILILAAQPKSAKGKIDWTKIGAVAPDIPALYQYVKEHKVDVVLVVEKRNDMTATAAIRVRKSNGLIDIWKVISEGGDTEPLPPFYDGSVDLEMGVDGIRKQIKRVLAEREMLAEHGIIGRSGSMRALASTIQRIAPTDVSVLIEGPSGAGKELIARAIHDTSSRSGSTFVAINCGALAEGVLESELFGHEKGAFTGSVSRREGLFKKADGGTIFLDEIGEMPPQMQVKLLRVLEDGTYFPVGSSVPVRTNARVVAATNRDLADAISDNQFREDLFYRISAVKLVVPPLMERPGDIQPLLQFFWRDHPQLEFTTSALERLMQFDWPGNVRQLRNFAQRMAALKPEGLIDKSDVERFLAEQQTTAKHLPVSTGQTVEQAGQELIYRAILSLGTEIRKLHDLIVSNLPGPDGTVVAEPASPVSDSSTMEEMEQALIAQALRENNGNRKVTARKLGIGERTLYRKLKKYGLS